MRPTMIGLFAVLIWGSALPILRILQSQIGLLATLGSIATAAGLLGLSKQLLRREFKGVRAAFANPLFYARWICFVLHQAMVVSAISTVQKPHLPLVILINYLWPTAVIVFSILFAGVRITRTKAFITGTVIVIASLASEILGAKGLSSELLASTSDRLAYFMVLIAALAWGAYSALTRRSGDASGGSAVLPIFQLTTGLALPLAFLPQFAVPMHITNPGMGLLSAYCIASFLAYLSWDHGMRKGSVVILSLFADFIPWLSLAVANSVLAVEIEPRTIVSAVMLVVGAMITRYGTLPVQSKQTMPDCQPQLAGQRQSLHVR